MKLNHDCIRDTLLFLENELSLGGHIRDSLICDKLPEYNRDDVMYTLQKLFEGKYISGNESEARSRAGTVKQITLKGHKFLDNIRPQTSWNMTKTAANKIGSVSIDILSTYAAKVTAELLAKYLGVNND